MALITEFQREFEGFSYNPNPGMKSSITRDSKNIRNSEGPGNLRGSTISMDLSIPEEKDNEDV